MTNRRALRTMLGLAFAGLLAACSSTSDRPKPAELPADNGLIGVRKAWNLRLGEIVFPLQIQSIQETVLLADSAGNVVALNSRTGLEAWRRNVGREISAGVGSDGKVAAVVTKSNELVAMEAGRELWRYKLAAQSFTAPLVAGGRVFVLTADRAVSAFDGASGRRLWLQQRPGEPLMLRQNGVLLAVGDTLVSGQGGRLVGLNPSNGTVRWESAIAAPRGTNDVERLADLVGGVSRMGDVVCARAFQTSVGCVNASRGNLLWSLSANGAVGVHGDADRVVGTEADGRVMAWKRSDGDKLWSSDRLQYRSLSAPLLLGRSVVLGDGGGMLHFLSREDGSPLTRMSTDGSAITVTPVLSEGTLVVATRSGGVYGFVPE